MSLCFHFEQHIDWPSNLHFPGMTAALTNESATSKSVYFAHCTSEMIFITHLLAEEPEKLAGPLLADTYVTLLKGRNSWYGQMLAKGELSRDMGENISGKGMIQVSIAISAKHFLSFRRAISHICNYISTRVSRRWEPSTNFWVSQAWVSYILKKTSRLLLLSSAPSWRLFTKYL